ncbi:MAG TPA: S-layer homology domain-containing protein [Casimicrobiaceae bacterium]|nr:S-layer homology domain-containing protein [Casimicrobiaceae bacterium]
MRLATITGALAMGALVSSSAWAVPCAGFGDVDSTDPFCPSVEWLKNRGITTGCAVGQYCPTAPVSRLAMAGFMKRLGDALQPEFVANAENGIFNQVNGQAVVCQTPDFATDTYPRVATPVGALLYHAGPAGNDVATRLVYRLPPSTLWQSWSGSIARATNPAGGYTSQSPTAPALLLQAGTTIAFGIQATSGTGAALAVSVAGCELNVRIDTGMGAGTPY